MRRTRIVAVIVTALCCVGRLDAQVETGTLNGRVVDSVSQTPVVSARVVVAGTSLSATTDAQGQFRIAAVAAGSRTIRVTRLGFYAWEGSVAVAAGGITTVSVPLLVHPVSLQAVVAVGYGTQLQRNVSGAVSTVTADQLNTTATATINQMLEGKAPGLNLATRTAQPGGGVSVNIRGAISPRGNSTPLYVVDGAPLTEYRSSVPGLIDSDLGFFGGIDRDPLSYLNPDDIESVTILKDASAAAIYGSAAANGVVLITTRSGRPGNVQVQYRSTYTSNSSYGYVPLMNAQQFSQQQNRLAYDRYLYDRRIAPYGTTNPATVPAFVPLFTAAQLANGSAGTDWLGMVTRDGSVQEHSVSATGGSANTRAYASFDYRAEEGLLRGSTLDRYAGRINVDQTVGSRARVSLKAVGSRLAGNNASSGANAGGGEKFNMLQAAYTYAPTITPYDTLGRYNSTYYPVVMSPAAFLTIADNSNTTTLSAIPTLDVDISRTLKVAATGNYASETTTRGFYLPRNVNSSALTGGAAQKSDASVGNATLESYLTYANTFGESEVNIVGGAGYYRAGTEGTSVQGVGFFTDAFTYNNLGVASDALRNRIASFKTARTKVSQFGRVNYTLRDRYIMSLVVRRDGSSVFAENHKYGVFPGVSGAWIASDESFVRDRAPGLSMLKLRLGYGAAGNESVLGTNTLDLYNPGYPFLIGTTLYNGVALSQIANPDLTWETVYTLNTGVDVGLRGDRVTASLDYFVKTARNLLDFNDLPANNAVGRVADNVGATRSKGFELGLRTVNIESGPLRWNSDLNISHFSRDWLERNPKVTLAPYIGAKDPIDAIYGWKTAGIIRTAADRPAYMPNANLGNLIYVDQNGDGLLNQMDVVQLGVSTPRWTVGFGNTLTFRAFDLSAFAYGQYGFKRYNNFAPNVADLAQATIPGNTTILAKDVWSADSPNGTRPGVAPNPYDSQNPTGTDFDLSDAGFLRLRNITVGYRLPKSVVRMSDGKSARVFVDLQNLAVRTRYPGFDPEFTELNPYPKARSVSVGLQASF